MPFVKIILNKGALSAEQKQEGYCQLNLALTE